MEDVSDREKKGVAFVFAAVPSIIDEVLNDKVLTFLRRSLHMRLLDVPVLEVREAYIETARASGKSISLEVAFAAARLSDGYPYMVQLIGYYMWQSAHRRGSSVIEMEDVNQAKEDALTAFGDAVCAPVFDALTEAQKGFVLQMARSSAEEVSLREIAEGANKSSSWASKYRASLIDEQVIESAGRGKVSFAIPYFKPYAKKRMI